jgi:hypothetical protein
MRRLNVLTIFVLAFLVGCVGTGVIPNEKASARLETGDSRPFIGMPVRTPGGEDIGSIIDVVAGPEGHEAFAVLGYWVSTDTQKRTAVPFGALACEEQHCVLNATRESLDAAPVFVSEGELTQRELAEDIYRYFGVQPYWTDEGITR